VSDKRERKLAHWTVSVAVAMDASVAFEHGAERTGPRLSVRQTRAHEASDVAVAEEVDRWISVAGTRGTRWSDERYCAASITPENHPVKLITASS
jgi:hypothetical protein